MTSTLDEFATKFRVADLTVLKLDHWTWSMRPAHCTLGSGILSLNRFCTSLAGITPAEGSELATAAKEIERRLRSAFQIDKLNYLMLMMVDAHLHFHVIPRYATPRQFAEISWVDAGWPTLPALNEGAAYQNHPVLAEICERLTTPV